MNKFKTFSKIIALTMGLSALMYQPMQATEVAKVLQKNDEAEEVAKIGTTLLSNDNLKIVGILAGVTGCAIGCAIWSDAISKICDIFARMTSGAIGASGCAIGAFGLSQLTFSALFALFGKKITGCDGKELTQDQVEATQETFFCRGLCNLIIASLLISGSRLE